MSISTLLGFVLLLMPIPLAFLIPASSKAAPDPWKVKRIRRSLIGFAVFVALIHIAFLGFQIYIWQHSSNPPEPRADGTFMWAIMSWFFLGGLIIELRRPKQDPFPGSSLRSARLTPRHSQTPVPAKGWWILGGLWLGGVLAVISIAPSVPATSWMLLAAAAMLLPFGPWFVRSQVLAAEPLPELANDELTEIYAQRRKLRSWATYVILGFGIVWKTGLALMLGFEGYEVGAPSLLMTTAACLLFFMLVYSMFEVSFMRRISRLSATAQV